MRARHRHERWLGHVIRAKPGGAAGRHVYLKRSLQRLLRLRDALDAKAEFTVTRFAGITVFADREVLAGKGDRRGCLDDQIGVFSGCECDVDGVHHQARVSRRNSNR
jgi:hypothetical protein